MFAKVFLFFYEVRLYLTPISCLFLLYFPFISEIRSDVLVLKNGERIKADNVKMKNGNLVEFRIGNVTKVIEFSKVDSILPEFSVSKKPITKPKISAIPANPSIPNDSKIPSAPEVKTETVEVKTETTAKEEIPFSKSRTSRTLQALVPGWSPLLLSDDRTTQLSGGIIAISELIVLYRGFEFFHSARPYFKSMVSPSSESALPWVLSSQNTATLIYFQYDSYDRVITTKDHIIDKSEYMSQQKFYGIALLTLISLDIYLSNTVLYRGNLRSVSVSPIDGGHGSSISISWAF